MHKSGPRPSLPAGHGAVRVTAADPPRGSQPVCAVRASFWAHTQDSVQPLWGHVFSQIHDHNLALTFLSSSQPLGAAT